MTIKLRKIENPQGIELLKEKLLPDEDIDPQVYLDFLRQAVLYSPRNIQILVALKDDEELVGFFITMWQAGTNYSFVGQAWCEAQYSDLIVPRAWARIQAWTEDLGLRKIRAETYRGDAVIRKYKFKELSRTVVFEIPQKLPVEEVIHGQDEVERQERVNAEQATAGDSGHAVPQLLPEHADGSDSVRGSADGGADAGHEPDAADAGAVPVQQPSAGQSEGNGVESVGGEDTVQDGSFAGTTQL
jgi:hypothetical protein